MPRSAKLVSAENPTAQCQAGLQILPSTKAHRYEFRDTLNGDTSIAFLDVFMFTRISYETYIFRTAILMNEEQAAILSEDSSSGLILRRDWVQYHCYIKATALFGAPGPQESF